MSSALDFFASGDAHAVKRLIDKYRSDQGSAALHINRHTNEWASAGSLETLDQMTDMLQGSEDAYGHTDVWKKQQDKIAKIRSAMARRREMLSQAGMGNSQFSFNTALNKENLYNK